MLRTVLRILFGFIVACLVAGVATVAFVVTPVDIATLPAEVRPERLGTAGLLSLLAATHSALFAFPFALVAVAIAEWQAIRSWIYYVIAGIAIALGGFGAEYLSEVGGQPTIVNDYAARAFLTVGFLSGLAYWLFAGRKAGHVPDAETLVVEATDAPVETSGKPPAASTDAPETKKPGGKLAQAAG